MVSEDHQFEQADAGCALTYPMQAGALRKGGHVMLKGNPCKITEISVSKTGKHGHAKCNITGTDIFTGKKCEDMCPSSHNVEVPNNKKIEYTVIDVAEDGSVSLLTETGDTKDDLNLPTGTDDDEKLCKELKEAFEEGKNCMVTVLMAMDKEKIIGWKESQ